MNWLGLLLTAALLLLDRNGRGEPAGSGGCRLLEGGG